MYTEATRTGILKKPRYTQSVFRIDTGFIC